MSNPKWQTTSSETVHQNPWYKVRKDVVVTPDGKLGEYYVVETPGPSVFVVVVNQQDEIYLIRQNRYQTDGVYWEVPGGNAGHQDSEEAAKRELQEETGFHTTALIPIGKAYPFNGASDEVSLFYLTKNFELTGGNKQAEEQIDKVKAFPIPEVLHMIAQNTICDTQSITAIFKALVYLRYNIQK